jgi:hypothetical protein
VYTRKGSDPDSRSRPSFPTCILHLPAPVRSVHSSPLRWTAVLLVYFQLTIVSTIEPVATLITKHKLSPNVAPT